MLFWWSVAWKVLCFYPIFAVLSKDKQQQQQKANTNAQAILVVLVSKQFIILIKTPILKATPYFIFHKGKGGYIVWTCEPPSLISERGKGVGGGAKDVLVKMGWVGVNHPCRGLTIKGGKDYFLLIMHEYCSNNALYSVFHLQCLCFF